MPQISSRLDAELLAAAQHAHRLAPATCAIDAHGESCAWYHGSWLFFRVLDLVSTPAKHAEHFAREIARLREQSGFCRVLVSGSADYGMLKTIEDSVPANDPALQITVVDRCATPLRICERFAAGRALDLTTCHQDILDYTDDEAFDAVLTHAFLGYFDPEDRRRLFAQWHSLLKPGGRLVTVQRVRENYAFDRVRFTPAEAVAFVARVTALSVEFGAGLEHYGIGGLARRYTDKMINWPIDSAAALCDLIEASGFRLTCYERVKTARKDAGTGPAVPNSDDYRQITAEKI